MTRFRSVKRTLRASVSRAFLVPNVALALLATAYDARAMLGQQFAGKIEVDPEYASGVNGATDIAFAADGRAVITRRTGQVVIRKPDGTLKTINYPFGMGQMDQLDTTFGEKGLLGVVADPDVATNKTFYFYMTNGPSNQDKHRVYKAVLNDDDTLTVMRPPIVGGPGDHPTLEGPLNHNGGGLIIHKGHLYIGVGDTGSNSTPPTNRYGSCLNKGNGKILRVKLDGSVPDDNPLVGMNQVSSCDSPKGTGFGMGAPDTRIWAWGLRNPWRFWIDPETDLMWIGDVGESTQEEISVGKGGNHFGYPFFEGTEDHEKAENNNPFKGMDCNDITPARDCTPPVYTYPTNKGAVIGGLIPSGCGWDKAFDGKAYYLFADNDKDWIRALPVNEQRTGVSSTTAVDFDTYSSGNPGPASFRMGPDDALYVVMNGAGAVYRYVPTDRTGPSCEMGGGGTGGTGGTGGAPPSGGSGGADTSSGTGGGTSPSGGTTSGGTQGMTGGMATTAGQANGGGSAGMPPTTAGSPSSAGAPGVAGSSPTTGGAGPVAGAGNPGGPPGGESKNDSGCGCRVAGGGAGAALGAVALAGVGGLVWRRRRRRPSGDGPAR